MGCGNTHKLTERLRGHLQASGIMHINQIADEAHTTTFQQAWRSASDLNIPGCWQREWRNYTNALMEAHIRIDEGEDELI